MVENVVILLVIVMVNCLVVVMILMSVVVVTLVMVDVWVVGVAFAQKLLRSMSTFCSH